MSPYVSAISNALSIWRLYKYLGSYSFYWHITVAQSAHRPRARLEGSDKQQLSDRIRILYSVFTCKAGEGQEHFSG